MLVHQVQDGIARATRIASIDEIMRLTWQGLAEGHLDDAAAEAIAVTAEARRRALRALAAPIPAKPFNMSRRPPRSPDRQRSIERRRGLAASGAVPSRIACHFTLAEVAVLTVIARQVRWRGQCDLHLDRIAALAGVSRTSVQNALRQARRLGLITVQERRYRGQRSDTNLIKVVSAGWMAWITRGGRVQNPEHHEDTRYSGSRFKGPDRNHYQNIQPVCPRRHFLAADYSSCGRQPVG